MVTTPSPRQRFAELVQKGETGLDLAEAALLIAQEEYPLLEPAPYLKRIQSLGERVKKSLPNRRDPLLNVDALNRVLFEEEKFQGNEEDYYDPRNSFLNEVIDRKTGIPITLSLLYREVARRAGLPVSGVGLPGHFIAAYLAPNRPIWIDPFHRGKFLTEQDCEQMVARIYEGRVPFRRESLRPVSGFAMLTRLLFNLKNIYVEAKSPAKALSVIEKLLLLNPGDWNEVRDRGVLWYQMKNYRTALADLESYLNYVPESEDRKDVLKLAELITRRLAGGG